ncbi:MAG TPA: hypothetical protein DCE41_28105 [Cytophagales bacterium]|nr:hypothetical protein [Cytophagales bacterium]HAA22220.1 hypothetical protein [Cytophagales bacterium]HAP62356.1 hypothetical protein [Cytophagales bacterium]
MDEIIGLSMVVGCLSGYLLTRNAQFIIYYHLKEEPETLREGINTKKRSYPTIEDLRIMKQAYQEEEILRIVKLAIKRKQLGRAIMLGSVVGPFLFYMLRAIVLKEFY